MSEDPNEDIIRKGNIPPWMEEVAERGGWKEIEETITIMSKMKPKSWKAIGDTVEILSDFLESGVTSGISDISQDFKDTLMLTVQEALSPLTNEVEQALADAFAPIMPEIQAFMTEVADKFSLGLGAIRALFEGNLDDWLTEQTIKFQLGIDGWSDDWKAFHLEVQKWRQGWENTWKAVGKDMDKYRDNFLKGWEEFWKNPLAGLDQASQDYNTWAAGVGQDIGAMWSGFWRDLGWK